MCTIRYILLLVLNEIGIIVCYSPAGDDAATECKLGIRSSAQHRWKAAAKFSVQFQVGTLKRRGEEKEKHKHVFVHYVYLSIQAFQQSVRSPSTNVCVHISDCSSAGKSMFNC